MSVDNIMETKFSIQWFAQQADLMKVFVMYNIQVNLYKYLFIINNFKGDTGTPLVQYNAGSSTTHQAIASFVSQYGCEFPSPSGYTRTFPYVTWIKNVTELP